MKITFADSIAQWDAVKSWFAISDIGTERAEKSRAVFSLRLVDLPLNLDQLTQASQMTAVPGRLAEAFVSENVIRRGLA